MFFFIESNKKKIFENLNLTKLDAISLLNSKLHLLINTADNCMTKYGKNFSFEIK